MLGIWNEIGMFEVSEQKLGGQALVIKNNGLISEIEMEELRREIELQEHQAETEHETTENSCNVNLEDLNDDVNGTSEDNVEITLDKNLQNTEEKMRADGLGEEEIKIMRMIQEDLSKEEMQQPMSLRFIDRKKLKEKNIAS